MDRYIITEEKITINSIFDIIDKNKKIDLSENIKNKISSSRDYLDKKIVISFLLDPKHHGKGFGKQLLKRGIEHVHQKWPNSVIVAKVMPLNFGSVNIFRKMGFIEKLDNEVIEFNLKL